jgi:hypothetical protein
LFTRIFSRSVEPVQGEDTDQFPIDVLDADPATRSWTTLKKKKPRRFESAGLQDPGQKVQFRPSSYERPDCHVE